LSPELESWRPSHAPVLQIELILRRLKTANSFTLLRGEEAV
jgi:hypothetical protein